MFLKRAALTFRRELIADGSTRLGKIPPEEFRMDGRFSLRAYRSVGNRRAGTRSKYHWLGLLPVIEKHKLWQAFAKSGGFLEVSVHLVV